MKGLTIKTGDSDGKSETKKLTKKTSVKTDVEAVDDTVMKRWIMQKKLHLMQNQQKQI